MCFTIHKQVPYSWLLSWHSNKCAVICTNKCLLVYILFVICKKYFNHDSHEVICKSATMRIFVDRPVHAFIPSSNDGLLHFHSFEIYTQMWRRTWSKATD